MMRLPRVFGSRAEFGANGLKSKAVVYWPLPLATMLAVCLLSGGCSRSQDVEQQSDLRAIAAYYSQFPAHNRGQVPASEKEFKSFVKAKGGAALSHKGLSMDDLFTSDRDGKPFIVKYRGDKAWPLPEVVAYEQDGRDGIRHAVTDLGGYVVITDEEFRSGKTTPAAANR
jgi:hypothetical protein